MRKFIFKTFICIFLVLLLHIFTVILFAGNKTDTYYIKFATPRQHSLILGTSRAIFAVQPGIIDEVLEESSYELPMFNFAFTIVESPYGEVYLHAVKKKLDESTRNGLFIITVDPWSISRMVSNETDDPSVFQEKDYCVGNMRSFNSKYNYEYLIKNYTKGWGTLITKYYSDQVFALQKDGWLEANVTTDSAYIANSKKRKVKEYKEVAASKALSQTRLSFLGSTIEYLSKHGDVFLVRLPVDIGIEEIENQFMPDFNERMLGLSQKYNVPYFNFWEDDRNEYRTFDGNHLTIESSKAISREIALRIKASESGLKD